MTLVDRHHASMRHFCRLMGQASDGAKALERDGVIAGVVPACPERSVLNAVVYDEVVALRDAYDEIAAAYAEIGASWTVWVHAGDVEAPSFLEGKGHALDALPDVMGRELGQVERPPAGALSDWTSAGRSSDVGPINDSSYDFGTDSFTRGLAHFPENAASVYTAAENGTPVACLMAVDHERNTGIEWVAVVPQARGKGLSGKLLAHALADAVERGAETSTLVATRAGRPVYERLGYRPVEVLQMWERRAR
jgi:GNAT superfamily N-acetyltransferase